MKFPKLKKIKCGKGFSKPLDVVESAGEIVTIVNKLKTTGNFKRLLW